jgi:hypothetical protein
MSTKKIAYKDNTLARENLPLPVVLYPGFYGAFFGFSQSDNSAIYLCSCAKESIENYIRFRLLELLPENTGLNKTFILNSMYFPQALVNYLIEHGAPNTHEVTNYLVFKNNLCHECNGLVPKYRYCHEMYGGAFKQNYGWYINKQAYEFGIEPISNRIIRDVCPQEILEVINLDPVETLNRDRRLRESNNFAEANRLSKELSKQNRIVWNIIENEVRQKFKHKKIGEAWVSETILYYILRHYRPDFLQGLEFDIFIKETNVAVEYQGIQHFEPIDYWGGIEGLKKVEERDRKKREICNSLGIHLVYFNYDEGLSNDLVSDKLKTYI